MVKNKNIKLKNGSTITFIKYHNSDKLEGLKLNNNQLLRQYKIDYGLTSGDIAKLTKWNIRSVDSWLANPDNANYREMKDYRMDYLEFKLKRRRKVSV
jgi:hypothetical protein